MGFSCLFVWGFFFVWKGIMPVQKNVEHFLETSCQWVSLMHIWDIGSTIISHSGSYHLSCCQTISRHICLSQGGENMSLHLEMERKAVLLAHPYHITTSGASGHTQRRLAPSTQCDAQKGKAQVYSVSAAYSPSKAASTVISCLKKISLWFAVHWITGSLPTNSKVAGDEDELMEPQWVWQGWAKASGGLCPAPRCSCCATLEASRQGKQVRSLANMCCSCSFCLQKKWGVSVQMPGHRHDKVWWGNGPGKKNVSGEKKQTWKPHS